MPIWCATVATGALQLEDDVVGPEDALRAGRDGKELRAPRRCSSPGPSLRQARRRLPRSTTSAATITTGARSTYWTRAKVASPTKPTKRSCALRDGSSSATTADVHRGENERVRDRVGDDERAEHEVGRRERERGRDERQTRAEVEAACEEVDRDRGERHDEDVLGLRQPERQLGIAGQPERNRKQRFEQRREMGRHTADHGMARLRDSPRERRIRVFVREVDGCLETERREHEAHDGAQPDERGEHHGDRGRRAVRRPAETRVATAASIPTSIGTRRKSLERRRRHEAAVELSGVFSGPSGRA